MRKQGPLRACQACPAAAPLGLSPSRCLSLPDTQQQPLCCFLKTKLSSQTRKKNNKHNMASQKCFLGMAGWKGDNLSPSAPHLSAFIGSHTLPKTHTRSTADTPLLFAGLTSSHSADGAWKSHFYLSGTKLWEQLKRMFKSVSKYYKSHSEHMQSYTY